MSRRTLLLNTAPASASRLYLPHRNILHMRSILKMKQVHPILAVEKKKEFFIVDVNICKYFFSSYCLVLWRESFWVVPLGQHWTCCYVPVSPCPVRMEMTGSSAVSQLFICAVIFPQNLSVVVFQSVFI